MKLVVLGLSLSSSWGNGHATTYRALLRAFADRGHTILFLERDVPWYAQHRDLPRPDFCELCFYADLDGLRRHTEAIVTADAVIVGSYVPDGVQVGGWVQNQATGVTAFYDIDTPVTLAKLARGDYEYLSPALIAGYRLYLSFTAGPALRQIEQIYHAPAARALFCAVDTDQYAPLDRDARWDLSYLGTYSADRQPTVARLLLEVAHAAPLRRFAVAGPLYPADIAWPANVERFEHVPPKDHPDFYAQSRFTLNVTRADMIAAGYSPSVRLFEAAACGTPIISDQWIGLDTIFDPAHEIVLAETGADVQAALAMPERQRRSIADAARARILAQHSAVTRAAELESLLVRAIEMRERVS